MKPLSTACRSFGWTIPAGCFRPLSGQPRHDAGGGLGKMKRIGRFVGGLTFCFFPAAPVFWLIGHFVGGGQILFAIWLLMLVWFAQISWRMARRREADR